MLADEGMPLHLDLDTPARETRSRFEGRSGSCPLHRILALAAAVALPKIEADQARVGAHQLVPAGIDHIYRIDTRTGDA